MANEKPQPEADEPSGAPEWMVTFSDCMTLLLTFFVLLLSFSSFDNQNFQKMNKSMVDQFSSLSTRSSRAKSSMEMKQQVSYNEELDSGSEHPTSNPQEIGTRKNMDKPNFRDQKVFYVPSSEIFWAKGSAISANGKKILSTLSEYLKNFPNRIVVYEGNHGTSGSDFSNNNINRIWAVVDFISESQNIDKSRFSLGSSSTLSKTGIKENNITSDRLLEIVMIERSVCN